MAIKIYEKFAPRANPADGDYPYGSIKNESVPGAKDGTPLDAVWANDYAGFDASLFAQAGIVPSGVPDKFGESQRLDAINQIVSKGSRIVRASEYATPGLLTAQNAQLQEGWDYAAANNLIFVVDGNYFVSPVAKTYMDGLVRNIGLQVPNYSQAIMSPNSKIEMLPNAEYSYYVINFYGSKNAKLYDFTVKGDVDAHLDTVGEGGHCYNVVNCHDIYLHNCHGSDAWGDGFYIGHEYSGLSSIGLENVIIEDCSTEHCGRNGMSVTASYGNLKIIRPINKGAFRTLPKAGIDVEPESDTANPLELKMKGVYIDSPSSENCEGAGLHVAMVRDMYMNANPFVDVTVVNPQDLGSEHGLRCDGYFNSAGAILIQKPVSKQAKKAPIVIDWLNTASRLLIRDPVALDGCMDANPINQPDTSCVAITTYDNRGSHLGNFEITGIQQKSITNTNTQRAILISDYSASPTRASNARVGIKSDTTSGQYRVVSPSGYDANFIVEPNPLKRLPSGDNYLNQFEAYSGDILYNESSTGNTFVYIDGKQPSHVKVMNGGHVNNDLSLIPSDGVRLIPYPANQGIKTKPGLGGGVSLELIPVSGNYVLIGDLSKWIEI